MMITVMQKTNTIPLMYDPQNSTLSAENHLKQVKKKQIKFSL